MINSSLIIIVFLIEIALLLALLFFLKRSGAKRKSIVISMITGVIVISLAFPMYIGISLGLANSSKNIRTKDVIAAENLLKNEFDITSMNIIVNRGWHCRIVIKSKSEINNNYQAITLKVENILNDGLSDKIIKYCEQKYNSSFIPRKERFAITFMNNQQVVHTRDLEVK